MCEPKARPTSTVVGGGERDSKRFPSKVEHLSSRSTSSRTRGTAAHRAWHDGDDGRLPGGGTEPPCLPDPVSEHAVSEPQEPMPSQVKRSCASSDRLEQPQTMSDSFPPYAR